VHHDLVGAEVQHLCDGLSSVIRSHLPNALRTTGEGLCKVSAGHDTLCQVYHRSDKLDVYLRWDTEQLHEFQTIATELGITFKIRGRVEKGWSKRWPVHIHILNDQDLQQAWRIIQKSAKWIGIPELQHDQVAEAMDLDSELILAFPEGGKRTVVVNDFERCPAARSACIAHYGAKCMVCGFDFETRYGAIGEGFIHVHHLVPVASIGHEYMVDVVNDLRPVCPNCHQMLHRRQPPYSIDELRRLLR
jgi:hypothetical protein